jgi:hypothetical protein
MRRCRFCKEEIDIAATVCPHCQRDLVPSRIAPAVEPKSLPLAVGLNLLLPGVGYMYMGRVGLGFAVFGLVLLMAVASIGLLVISWFGLNVIMAIDMILLANKNKSEVQAATTRKCPHCAEFIKLDAKVCKHCGRDVVRPTGNAGPRPTARPPDRKVG